MQFARFLLVLVPVVCSVQAICQPSLEATRALTVSAVSSVSDGYGLRFVRVNGGGQVEHDLLDNNGVIITGYSSVVATGDFPVITSFNGKLRVAIRTAQQSIRIFQSNSAGQPNSWSEIANTPTISVNVFDLDAYTDDKGTHIVWATAPTQIAEIWYMSYRDVPGPVWTLPFNVTDLPAQQSGFRPKVTTTTNEAHVTFAVLEGPPFNSHRMYSRDLSLSSGGTWESAYAISPQTEAEPISSLNTVAIGDSIYALIAEARAGGASINHGTQAWWFTQRHKNDLTWRPLYYLALTSSGLEDEPMRTRMVVGNDNALYFLINCNYYDINPTCQEPYLILRRYQQAAPNFSTQVLWSSLNQNEGTGGSSLLLSRWHNGVYAHWTGSPNNYNMRRKPLAITGTIAEPTLLTGNNWITGTLSIGPNVSIRLKPGSITRVLSGAQITVNSGVSFIVESGAALIFESGTQMSFAPGTGIDCAGTMTTVGAAAFTSTSPSTQWNGILLTGAASQIDGAVISNALIGIKADQNAGHSVTNCTIDGGNYGVYLYSGNFPGAQLATLVDNNTIMHSSAAGIYVDATSKPIIQNNILQGLLAPLVGNYGIVFMFSSPQNVVGNKISAYGNAGIYCYRSSPAFVDEADAGYNCSFNNTGTGILAESKAFPVLGILAEHLPGKNTFSVIASPDLSGRSNLNSGI